MAKKTKAKSIIKKIVAWILLIAMILSVFAMGFSALGK